jgi:acyl-CoA reductase-like NAD-dependent aldehyde dehydrogenase
MGVLGQEEWTSRNNPKDQTPAYTFQGSSPSDELLEVARLYQKEAKQLLARAQEALAEDRQEEARLLTDLAIARRERADDFEKAARDEGRDPIVAEILNSQQSQRNNYSSYTQPIPRQRKSSPQSWLEEMKPPPLGRIARAVAWIGSWIA